MKAVAWMGGVSAVAWFAAAVFVSRAVRIDLFFGMLGPLLIACVSWLMAERKGE